MFELVATLPDRLFIGIGRVRDGVPLAWLRHEEASLADPSDIFRKLLAAAKLRMQPGQRTTLQWETNAFCCLMSADGDTLAAMVISDKDRQEPAYSSLLEVHKSMLQEDSLETAEEGALNDKLMPLMLEALEVLRDAPLQVFAQLEGGYVNVACVNLAGESLGTIPGLGPEEFGSRLAHRIRELVPAPPGARWKVVLPDQTVLAGDLVDLPLHRLFGLDYQGKVVRADNCADRCQKGCAIM